MASTDAKIVPIKNTAFRITFAMRLNTGLLNSGAAGVTQQVSLDGATFANCTNTATEIATSSGIYYLDLVAAEMNARTVALLVKSTTTNAVPVDIILYPQQGGDIPADVQTVAGSTPAATAQKDLGVAALLFTVDTSTYTSTTIDFETSLTSSVATDFYNGRSIMFISGTLNGQAARITGTSYTVNSKVKLTVTTLTSAPANGVSVRMM